MLCSTDSFKLGQMKDDQKALYASGEPGNS